MKWTKHATNASTSDPIVSRVQEKFKIVGYGMYFKLIEVIGGHLEHKDQPPSVKLSVKMWSKHLMCRPTKLLQFLKELEDQSHIFLETDGEFLEVTMPSIRESLDNKAISSSLRNSTGAPEKKEKAIDQNKKEKGPEGTDDLFFLTEKQIDRVRLALSKSGAEVINAIGPVIEEIFREIGPNDDAFEEVSELIHIQFQKNEKSQALGESVLVTAKKIYRSTVSKLIEQKKIEDRESRRKAALKKEEKSPNKNDKRCTAILRQLEADSHLEIHEMSIDPGELQYFIEQNISYYGEEWVESQYGHILEFLESVDDTLIDDDDDDWDEDDDFRFKPKAARQNNQPKH